MRNNIATIILAAGSSSRLGKPKQVLPYKNTTLLEHAIITASSTGGEEIIVVTGANHQQIFAEVDLKEAEIIENSQWQSGMASSIHAGIDSIKNDSITGVLIMLCDQPLITSQHLNNLVDQFNKSEDKKIIATGYGDIAGVPAVFPKSVFPELLKLSGDEGARKMIKSFERDLVVIPAEGAVLDIDTLADYEKLMTILADKNI